MPPSCPWTPSGLGCCRAWRRHRRSVLSLTVHEAWGLRNSVRPVKDGGLHGTDLPSRRGVVPVLARPWCEWAPEPEPRPDVPRQKHQLPDRPVPPLGLEPAELPPEELRRRLRVVDRWKSAHNVVDVRSPCQDLSSCCPSSGPRDYTPDPKDFPKERVTVVPPGSRPVGVPSLVGHLSFAPVTPLPCLCSPPVSSVRLSALLVHPRKCLPGIRLP